MQYLGLAVVVAMPAVVIVLLALRMLIGGNWLLGWLRGSFGLLLLGLATIVGLLAFDVSGYAPIADEPLATVRFQAQGSQRYEAVIRQGGQERSVTLEGELWQLQMHVLRWRGLAALIGLEPGYRLDTLSGRYLSVEQQEQARHIRVSLAARPLIPAALWDSVQVVERELPFIDWQVHRLSYLPIADGAAYDVSISPTGLLATPANAKAKQALKDW